MTLCDPFRPSRDSGGYRGPSRGPHLSRDKPDGVKSLARSGRKWSVAMDEIASLTQQLVGSPVDNLENLVAKFDAILWLIEVNESLLDSGDLRRLRRFARDLSVLAGGQS